MNLTTNHSDLEKQLEDLKRITGIIDKIYRLSNDPAWVNQVTDELFMQQPFLLSMLMGYKLDLSATELNEALTLYMTIWEYFKASPEAKTRAITEIRFDHFQELNIKMLATMEPADFKNATVLQTVLFERFNIRPALFNIETQATGALLIGVKVRSTVLKN